MEMNVFFENIIKMNESSQTDGLQLATKSAVNERNLAFIEHIIKELNCGVYFTKDDSESKDKLVSTSNVIKEAESNPNVEIIIKVNKTKSSDGCFAYFNEKDKSLFVQKFGADDHPTDKRRIVIQWEDETFALKGTGAFTKDVKVRGRTKGTICATYLDGKILPSSKAELDELIDDANALGLSIDERVLHYSESSKSDKINAFAQSYNQSSACVTYNFSSDEDIDNLLGIYLKIAEAAQGVAENAKQMVIDTFTSNTSNLPPDALEAAILIYAARMNYTQDIEFYESKNFKLVDFVVVKNDGSLFPVSVKDADGGNSSTCVPYLRSIDDHTYFDIHEMINKNKFKVNEYVEIICKEYYLSLLDFMHKNGFEPGTYSLTEIGFNKKNFFTNVKSISDANKVTLGEYFAAYLVKAANRKRALSARCVPGFVFSEIVNHTDDTSGKYLRKLLLNGDKGSYDVKGRVKRNDLETGYNHCLCERIAVQMINLNENALDILRDAIADEGANYFGTDVIKMKATKSGGVETIPQSAKMRLKCIKAKGSTPLIIKYTGSELMFCSSYGGQGQFFGYEFISELKESNNRRIGRFNEYNQADFNRDSKLYMDRRARGSVSTKDKWNLKMDIAELKGDLVDLQNTASDLPDEFVDEICDTESYPFDSPIDDDQSLNSWCNEMDAFLSQDLDNWGAKKQ